MLIAYTVKLFLGMNEFQTQLIHKFSDKILINLKLKL